MFVNAVAIRQAISLRHGIILPRESVVKLETASYLFHSALNSYFVAMWQWRVRRLRSDMLATGFPIM